MTLNDALGMIDALNDRVDLARVAPVDGSFGLVALCLLGLAIVALVSAVYFSMKERLVLAFPISLFVMLATVFSLVGVVFSADARRGKLIEMASHEAAGEFAEAGGCDVVVPAIRSNAINRLDDRGQTFLKRACGERVVEAAFHRS